MSEKNNNIFENDLLMRAILEGGQEEVPGRVWDAVSERLDKDGTKVRKPAALWWKRAGAAVAAAAAVTAVVILTGRNEEQTELLPRAAQGDMIAVVEAEDVSMDNSSETPENVIPKTSNVKLLAYVPDASIKKSDSIEQVLPSDDNIEANQMDSPADMTGEPQISGPAVNTAKAEETANYEETWQTFEEWEEETPVRKVKTSIVVSGLTEATRQQTSATRSGILKAPSMLMAPTQTGIKEKANQTKYGLPMSVGAGIRFEFSPRWSLGVGLNYTCLTRSLQGTYTHVNEAGSIDNLITSEIRNSQHYIGLPVNVFFNIINSGIVNFYTYAGGTAEKCLADKYHVMSGNIIHKEQVGGMQLSAAFGLGAEFALTQHLGLYFDPSLRYYFDCDQPKSIRTAQPLTFGVEAGLRFKL